MNFTLLILACFCFFSNLRAYMFHNLDVTQDWTQEKTPPFNEWILSWNATRPQNGRFVIQGSVKIEDSWTPWLVYATWGSDGQSSFKEEVPEKFVRVYQDALEVLEGKKGEGFRVRILAEGDADLSQIRSLHVYTNSDQVKEPTLFPDRSDSIFLPVKGISQMTLLHERCKDLCSPTSSSIVTRFLSNHLEVDPVEFALKAWDGGFDIFGNWVFNVAEAASRLGPDWHSWVERLHGFEDIYRRLAKGAPVVISIRGPLTGSALPYSKGHLMVVIGYDSEQKKVHCIDPAFPHDEKTHVSYDLDELILAWGRRGKIAYIFDRS